MIARLPSSVLALILVAAPGSPVMAQEVTRGVTQDASQGEAPACFCLAEKVVGSIAYFGCAEATPATRVTPIAQCVDPGTRAVRTIRDAARFDRLADGEGACDPCDPTADPGAFETRPRGDDDEAPATR